MSKKLPEASLRAFDAQYFVLAQKYDDFGIWANLHEHEKTAKLVKDLSAYVHKYVELVRAERSTIDIGFLKLHNAVLAIPEVLHSAQVAEIVEGLRRHYEARVAEPIIEDKYEPEENQPQLTFPSISEAFIPQSYRALLHSGKGSRLESEDTWTGLPVRDDLGAFLLNYLSSPYSIETPLVVLGHPGSGKSLLTKVLSATLLSREYTPIRVPLREVDSDAPIESQIEQAISAITGLHVDSWAHFSNRFRNNPPVVILDGYDELLQASGRVFSGYLTGVRNFQHKEVEQGRPVRVIVTSRLTLIDKATMPTGSTIIRLLEFDKPRRDKWISIWNKANRNYFKKSEPQVQPFSLPSEDDTDGKNVLALSEQPLLLLMLAIFDSDKNRLRKSKGLDRTILYDSLLRRFVEREKKKDPEFEHLKERERQDLVDRDMQRLGVAAIGMYNRRKLHILSQELNGDVTFFELERKISSGDGRPLSQADMLLGSFFFVHKSRAKQRGAAQDQYEESSAFEFLHNTFGEFLTADFILRQAIAETESLAALSASESLKMDRQRKLDAPDGFAIAWFACLIYTPLFSRPVVLGDDQRVGRSFPEA